MIVFGNTSDVFIMNKIIEIQKSLGETRNPMRSPCDMKVCPPNKDSITHGGSRHLQIFIFNKTLLIFTIL